MIDPTIELPIPLCEVPAVRWLRKGSQKVAVSTVFRWAQRGIRGTKLEVIRIGGTMCTSEAALRRFFERLTCPLDMAPPATASGERERRISAASQEVAAAGI